MDTLRLIREKRDEYASLRDASGLDSVLKHLVAAERHFFEGRDTGDDTRFTDVIYRTNQVFEGLLKEAYQVISGVETSRMTPNEIEQKFESDEQFSKRILEYFKQYRQRWRNPSTHDHRLDFTEQEALLALTTVSAFCFVAFDEILKSLASEEGAASSSGIGVVPDGATEIVRRLTDALPEILRRISSGTTLPRIRESLVIGAVQGFLSNIVEKSVVASDTKMKFQNRTLRPDIVYQDAERQIVIEIKSLIKEPIDQLSMQKVREQVRDYALAANAQDAILVFVPAILNENEILTYSSLEFHDDDLNYWIVFPSVH